MKLTKLKKLPFIQKLSFVPVLILVIGLIIFVAVLQNRQNTRTRAAEVQTTSLKCDINGDGKCDISDYQILIGCYSNLLPAISCTSENKLLSDMDGNGVVDEIDINTFLRTMYNLSDFNNQPTKSPQPPITL